MRLMCAVLACAMGFGSWASGSWVSGAFASTAPSALVQASERPLAEAVSERPESVAVVVYRDRPVNTSELLRRSRMSWSTLDREGLALIVEKRVVDLPAGEGVIRFKGLATGIVPHSATIEGLPAGLLEQNADYDLISPKNLLERAVGETVTVVRTNRTNGEVTEQTGVLRAGTNGAVVEVDGRFEALDCSGLTERLVFEAVPEGLGATPTLSIRTRVEQAGRHEITLAYLTAGLQWSADYVARVSPDADTISLEGWITLANFGGTSFADAPVVVVAGDVARNDDTRPIQLRTRYSETHCWPGQRTHEGHYPSDAYAGPPPPPPPAPPPAPAPAMMREALAEVVVTGSRVMAKQEELGDYKTYVIPHLTTVAARQTKQVLFLAQSDIPVKKVMVASFQPSHDDRQQPLPTMIELRVRNDEASGLGLPVPEGNVAFYTRTDSQPTVFAGSDKLADTPVGLPLRLWLQRSRDVTSHVIQTGDAYRGRGTRRKTVESYTVAFENRTNRDVDVELPLTAPQGGSPGFRIEREGVRSTISAETGQRVWRLRLAAGEQRTFDIRWSYDNPE